MSGWIASDLLLGKLAAFVTGLLVTVVDIFIIIVLRAVSFRKATWRLMNMFLRDQLLSQEYQTYDYQEG